MSSNRHVDHKRSSTQKCQHVPGKRWLRIFRPTGIVIMMMTNAKKDDDGTGKANCCPQRCTKRRGFRKNPQHKEQPRSSIDHNWSHIDKEKGLSQRRHVERVDPSHKVDTQSCTGSHDERQSIDETGKKAIFPVGQVVFIHIVLIPLFCV